ncbi:MAG: ABC transporter substrate-binding protein [Sulfolobales archaeon]
MRTQAVLTIIAIALIAIAITIFITVGSPGIARQGIRSAETPASPAGQPSFKRVSIGIIPTIDSIPFIIAEREGLYRKYGLDAEITMFSSARERDAAMEAGRIEVAINDPVTSIILISKGSGAKIVSLLLGQIPSDGVFYILAPPNTSYGLESVRSIAISRNTIIEFITDKMLELLRINTSIEYIDVPSIPVRYQLLLEGKVQAATLPDPWGTMALLNGARLLARDDQFGVSISMSTILASKSFISREDSRDILISIVKALNEALSLYKRDPQRYADLIYQRLQIPQTLAGRYLPSWGGEIAPYPRSNFDMVAQWLYRKGLIQSIPSYDESVVFREGEKIS